MWQAEILDTWRRGKVPTRSIEFSVPERLFSGPDLGSPRRVFRDPAGMIALSRLVAELNEVGYQVSAPRPGKGVEACSRWRLNKLWEIDLLLGVLQREAGLVYLYLEMRLWRHGLRFPLLRGPEPDQDRTQHWDRLSAAIQARLSQDYDFINLDWTTD